MPAHRVRPEAASFCCGGCEQVWRLLHEQGLEDFYGLRDREGAAGQPARPRGRTFADFDDALFRDRYTRPTTRGTREVELFVEGVHCAACAWLIERLGDTLPGLLSARLDLPRARVQVEWDPDRLPLSAVARALDAMGYPPHPWREADLAGLRQGEDRRFLLRVGLAAAAAMNVMFLHVALYAGEAQGIDPRHESLLRWASLVVTAPVVVWSARPFATSAWAALRRRVLHIDLPIAVAIWAGFLASAWHTVVGRGQVWFDSIAMLVALLLAGRWLLARAQRRALDTAERLHGGGLVDFARRREPDGTAREVPVDALRPGEILEVRSGEVIPADGVVLEGHSRADHAALTGEAGLRPVGPGDPVHAHTVNVGAALVVETTAVGPDTRVGALLALVEEARRRQAPLVAWTDRIGRGFVGALLAVAIAAGAWWTWTEPDRALERVIALLVVACPCALGLATPIAMTAALTRAARAGLYIKGADVLQAVTRVREVVFDKTGTLTEGRITVARWRGDDAVRPLAAAVARHSAHPVARALAGPGPEAVDVVEEPGRGMAGTVDGRRVAVGSVAWMESLGARTSPALAAQAGSLAREGLSPTCVAVDGEVRAVAGLGDPLRPEAAGVVARLRRRGWTVHLLSGDHPEAVAAVARALDLPPEVARGGCTPEEKLARVTALTAAARARGEAVMMVGDGINDAAALAAVDVGVGVLGASGASIQAADVVLTRTGLAPVLDLEIGARRVLGVIHRNLALSLGYNLVVLGLALSGHVGPLLAAVLMPISSLTVIGSSVATRTFSPPRAPARPAGALLPAAAPPGGASWR